MQLRRDNSFKITKTKKEYIIYVMNHSFFAVSTIRKLGVIFNNYFNFRDRIYIYDKENINKYYMLL